MLILYDMKDNYPDTYAIQARLQNCKLTIHHWWKPGIQLSVLFCNRSIVRSFSRPGRITTYGPEIVTEARENATTFWIDYQRASRNKPQQPPSPRSHEKKKPNLTEPMSILTSKLHALTMAPATSGSVNRLALFGLELRNTEVSAPRL